jgi:LPS-assembly lipoprotein
MIIRRQVLLACAAAALAGCGYRPLYSSVDGKEGVATKLAGIGIPEQRTRYGQLVRNELLSAMSPPGESAPARYHLALIVRESDSYVSRLPSQPVDRRRYRLSASYELLPVEGKKSVSRGSTFAAVSYDTVREPISDLQARNAAMQRAAIELAQDIRLRLSAFLSAEA